MRQKLKLVSSNGNLYYFLIQAFGRVLILLRFLGLYLNNNFFLNFLIILSLVIKLGGAPFHF
jgi:hypothetical protein